MSKYEKRELQVFITEALRERKILDEFKELDIEDVEFCITHLNIRRTKIRDKDFKEKILDYFCILKSDLEFEKSNIITINKNSLIFLDFDSVVPTKYEIERLSNDNTVVVVMHTNEQYSKVLGYKLSGNVRIENVNSTYKESVDMRIHSMISDAIVVGIKDIIVISKDNGYTVYSEINNLELTQVKSLDVLRVESDSVVNYSSLFDVPKHSLRDIDLGIYQTKRCIKAELLEKIRVLEHENKKLNNKVSTLMDDLEKSKTTDAIFELVEDSYKNPFDDTDTFLNEQFNLSFKNENNADSLLDNFMSNLDSEKEI